VSASTRGKQDKIAARGKSGKGPKCPICGKLASQDYRPFCGAACADIDLGRWLAGRYVVPGEPVSDSAETEDGD
jgi:endogenous inhibitor of DNA gyrase (YacG/DUF329 family)